MDNTKIKIKSRSGIILAAGLGNRLNISTQKNELIKPLAVVDGLILLMRTINSLETAGCNHIVIVMGWQAAKVKKYVLSHYTGTVEIEFSLNKNFNLKNGISVLCARSFVGREFILTMADHILDDKIMYLARDHHPPEKGATLCVDYKLETIFDIEDATKVLAEDTHIKQIGKELKIYNCIDTGVFIGTEGLMAAIDQVYQERGDASLSEGVQLLANKGLMKVVDIKDAFWQDVDNMDMLLHAEKLLRRQAGKQKRSALN